MPRAPRSDTAAPAADGLCPGPRSGSGITTELDGACLLLRDSHSLCPSLRQPLSRRVSSPGGGSGRAPAVSAPGAAASLCCAGAVAVPCREPRPGPGVGGAAPAARQGRWFCHRVLHKIYTTIYLVIKTDPPPPPPPGNEGLRVGEPGCRQGPGRGGGAACSLAGPCRAEPNHAKPIVLSSGVVQGRGAQVWYRDVICRCGTGIQRCTGAVQG